MFETFIIQPIYNLLLLIYALLPGNDFGLAIILFTVIVRFAMWPLLKKQLHQTRVMRKMQPKIKEIKSSANGDKQKEAELLMELYREEGISPFGTIGLLFVQLPVFFGLFAALRAMIDNPGRIINLPYTWLKDSPLTSDAVQPMMQDVANKTNEAIASMPAKTQEEISIVYDLGAEATLPQLESLNSAELGDLYSEVLISPDSSETLVQGPYFDQNLFSVIDLSFPGFSSEGIYLPVIIIALLAGIFQYLQTKQIAPDTGKKKKLSEIFKQSARGEEPDQADINAAVTGNMTKIFAPLIAIISATSPAGLAVYFATSGALGYFQQRFLLNKDVEEMEEIAQEPEKPKTMAKSTNSKAKSSKSTTSVPKEQSVQRVKAKKSSKKKNRKNTAKVRKQGGS